MARTLSIYACSGIGSNAHVEHEKYDYWLDNTNSVTNTQAVNSLLARINTDAIEILNLELTDEEVLERLNEIDWYAATLYFVQQYESRADQIVQLRRAIGKAWDNGLFEYVEFDNKKRDLHLDEVIGKIAQYMDDANIKEPSSTFRAWWNEEVANKNKVGLTTDQQQKIIAMLAQRKVSGIGANYDQNPDLAKYLNNGAEYFLYTYATDEQINQLPKVFKNKRAIQRSIYNYCKEMYVGVFGSEKQMQEVIYSGIVATLHTTPQQAIKDSVVAYNAKSSENTSGVGFVISAAAIVAIKAITALIAAIGAILGIVYGIIVAICDCVKASEAAKWSAINDKIVEDGNPTDDDFKDFNLGNKKKNNNTLLIGAAVVLAALLLGRK